MKEASLSNYAKVFVLLLKVFEEPKMAIEWLAEYGQLYEANGIIINSAGLKVIPQEALNKIKIYIGGEEWQK